MKEIKCPHCLKVFSVDDADYASILNQVKNSAYEEDIHNATKNLEEKYNIQIESTSKEYDSKINELKLQLENQATKKDLEAKDAISLKDNEIASLKAQIEAFEEKMDSSIKAKENEVNQTYSKKLTDLELQNTKELASKDELIATLTYQAQNETNELKLKSQYDKEITALKEENNKLSNDKKQEIAALQNKLDNINMENSLKEETLNKQHQLELNSKDEQIAYYKDLKTKMSTKMIGENLEQHCRTSFEQVRPMAFPNAYFDKDNKVSEESSSKGDFIFRDYQDGVEYISIMFEMKNEADETAKKHKNEEFFKELDKDRNEKGCEYAVLVSLLESDSELYNQGIVDVSHKYPKMFVIRPQFFIPLISLLRNAAAKSIEDKKALQLYKQQNIDVTNFENAMNDFKDKFNHNYVLATKKFEKSIEDIDKAIKNLQDMKDNLLGVSNNLRLANEKAQDLSIKKLTKNNPTMKAKFEEANKSQD